MTEPNPEPFTVRGYIDPMQLANTADELANQIRKLSGMLQSFRQLADDWDAMNVGMNDRTLTYCAKDIREILDQ